jgi:hypothetical protein
MATNAPPSDGHRNGVVKKRSQLETKIEGEELGLSATKRRASSLTSKRTTGNLRPCAANDPDQEALSPATSADVKELILA